MPTYDFKCTKCENTVEQNVPIALRDAEFQCDECGGALLREITFKGLTWAPTAGGMR